jgi:hypothetical protein
LGLGPPIELGSKTPKHVNLATPKCYLQGLDDKTGINHAETKLAKVWEAVICL